MFKLRFRMFKFRTLAAHARAPQVAQCRSGRFLIFFVDFIFVSERCIQNIKKKKNVFRNVPNEPIS